MDVRADSTRQLVRLRGRSYVAFVFSPVVPIVDWLGEIDNTLARSPGYFVGKPTVPFNQIVDDINLDMFLPLYALKVIEVQGLAESSLGESVRAAAKTLGVDVQTDRVNALICSQCNATLDISACAPLTSTICTHCGAAQTVPARFASTSGRTRSGSPGLARSKSGSSSPRASGAS